MSRKLKPKHKRVVAKRQPPKWQRERNIALIIWILIPLTIVSALALVAYWGYDNYVAVWRQPVTQIGETTVDMDYFVKMLRFYPLVQNPISDPYQVLQEIEENELVREAAPEFNIQIPAGNVTELIENSFSSPGQGNLTQQEIDNLYQELLDRIKLTDDEYRRLIETDLIRMELWKSLKEQEVPEEAKHVHLLTLRLDTEEEASQALGDLYAKHGGNITALAGAYETAVEDLNWVPKGIHPEFDEIAFSVEAGNVTAQGSSLVKVAGIAENIPISANHRTQLANTAFQAWLQEKRSESVTRYVDQDKINWAVDQTR